jgi:hypothetical protein
MGELGMRRVIREQERQNPTQEELNQAEQQRVNHLVRRRREQQLERAENQQAYELRRRQEQQHSTASTVVPGLLPAGQQAIDLRGLYYQPFSLPDALGIDFSFQERENDNRSTSEDSDYEHGDYEDGDDEESDDEDSDSENDAVHRATQRRLQQNREHLLPRYYKLVEEITPDLWRWSLTIHSSAMNHSKHILSEEDLERKPTPQVFRDIGCNLLSKDSERVLAAATVFENFIESWVEYCSGESRKDLIQDVSEIANMKEFIELLREECMEKEKDAWFWCILHRTGCDVNVGTSN